MPRQCLVTHGTYVIPLHLSTAPRPEVALGGGEDRRSVGSAPMKAGTAEDFACENARRQRVAIDRDALPSAGFASAPEASEEKSWSIQSSRRYPERFRVSPSGRSESALRGAYRPRVPLHTRRSACAFRSTCWTCLENLKLQPFPLARRLRSPDCVRAAVEPGFAGRALNLDIRSAGSMVIASMKPIGASM